MSDLPVSTLGAPFTITPVSYPESVNPAEPLLSALSTFGSTTWPASNDARYYPFTLYDITTIYQLFWYVGATQSGNIDVAIYDAQKNRIVSSGSTAMSATVNTVQELNITDTVLMPGNYLMGGACSLNTGTIFAGAAGNDEIILSHIPIYMQATAMALPNPCVPILTTATSDRIYAFGALCRSVY